jgi:hypothetical protein
MKHLCAALLLLLGLAAVTGCTELKTLITPEPRWRPAAEDPALPASTAISQEDRYFLVYFNFLQQLTDAELIKEFRIVKERFGRSADEEDRWRLIFLSILPGQPFSDRDYALELLRGSQADAGAGPEARAGLGKLLRLLLAEQAELRGKLSAEKERAGILARQLQELKEIENILSERDKNRPAAQ